MRPARLLSPRAPPATAPGHRPGAAPRPNLITNVATTDATVPDSAMLPPIHQALRKRGLLPDEHYLDSGYPSAELIVGSLDAFGIALITPVLLDHSRQARAEQGFAAPDFTIDWQARQVTCPAGQTSSSWTPCVQYGSARTVVTFSKAVCGPCPVRTRCTTAKSGRRQISLHPREMTEALRSARAEQQTKDWRRDYALRAGVEGTCSLGNGRHRTPPHPLPGPGQDPSRTRLLRRRTQPDPP
ncbi:hypothetical protein FDZ84_34100 [Saccharopolyspora sp. ASAGF58]|nr:hypothetical protein FDZ84_34100 [Saccharopolyspora sp. ASAGF58]